MIPMDASAFWMLVLLLQAICLVHLIRNQRPWLWLVVVLGLPPIGPLVYLLLEVTPLRRSHSGGLQIPLPQSWLIRQAERTLAERDSWDNKAALAELYARAGRHEEAAALLEPALKTPFKKDPYILFALAMAVFESGDLQRAEALLDAIDATERVEIRKERELLRARIRAAEGAHAAARKLFELAAAGFNGEEARCRYACWLMERGEPEAARREFHRIVENARRAPGKYRREEADWIRLAKAHLRAMTT